jgi:hypothetical protein
MFGSRTAWPWASALLVLTGVLLAANYYTLAPLRVQILEKEELQLSRTADSTAAAVENVLNVSRVALESIRSVYQKQLTAQ